MRSLAILVGCSCATTATNAPHIESEVTEPILITDASHLDANVGKLVTLRGEVTNTKIPTLIDVDIASDDPDLRGRPAEATGVLERTVITQEELDAKIAEIGMFAHRGPGTFYRLEDPQSGKTVQVTPGESSCAEAEEGKPCVGLIHACSVEGDYHSYFDCLDGTWVLMTEQPLD